MNRETAKRKLSAMLMKCSIAYSDHSKKRMKERKFTAQDVLKALHGGVMIGEPTQTKHFNGFECVMQIWTDEGKKLDVPIVIDEDNQRIIIKSTVRKK